MNRIYAVVVTNQFGNVASRIVNLAVGLAPVITQQPQDQVAIVGTNVTFTVAADSATLLSYQWRKNGVNLADVGNISGAAAATLTLSDVQETDAGNYSVVVANAAGSVTSSVAVLTVSPRLKLYIKGLGTQVLLSWLTNWTDFAVETSSNLAVSAVWRPLTGGLAVSGNWFLQTNLPLSNPAFYRLHQQSTSAPSAGLVWIAPGTFTMGSPSTEKDRSENEGPQTQVTLSRGFWMSKYLVTQEEYLAVMGNNPSSFTGDLKRPVEQVSWVDATNYCCKLTQQERSAGRLPAGYVYRLPTEAEWEYACRAGTTTATAFGDNLSSTQANFNGNYPYNGAAIGPYLGRTTAVGSYTPNAWGLYDMHGNVWEWCLDWYGTYPGRSITDPQGPDSGSNRVFRGGSWGILGWYCRSAQRSSNGPDFRYNGLGFRPVLAPGQ